MDEREALTRAVVAAPDDDLPRLVFADWLEERDEPARATFVRAQVELAATPPWEPFAVRLRHREPDLVTGAPWRSALPRVDGRDLEWHPEYAFRRGFAWGLFVRDVATFFAEAPRLFDTAPIGQLHLPRATLDQWRHFAAQPWLPRVKSLHFYGTRTPIEAIRELAESPGATGIGEMVFEASSRAGMPVIVRDLLRSPLGRRLRRLELRVGPEDVDDFTDALCDAGPTVTELSLVTFGLTWEHIDRLAASGLVAGLGSLSFADVPDGWRLIDRLAGSDARRNLSALRVIRSNAGPEALPTIADSESLGGLKMLDLSDQTLQYERFLSERVVWSESLAGLRSLSVRKCQLGDQAIEVLTRTRCWPTLVELDLRDNRLTDAGAERLLAAPIPPDLTALGLRGNRLSDGIERKLRRHFGERVVL